MEHIPLLHEKFTEFSKMFIEGNLSKANYLAKTLDLERFLISIKYPLVDFVKLSECRSLNPSTE